MVPMTTTVVPLSPSQTPDGAYRYLVDVDVGEPSQRIAAMLDTGSHYLMLRDSSQGACRPGFGTQAACRPGHSSPQHRHCFNASASSTFRDDEAKSETVEFSIDGLAIEATFDRAFDRMVLSEVNTSGAALPSSGSGAADGTPLSLIGSTASGAIGPVCRLPYFWADAAGVLGVSPRRRLDSPQSWESYITRFGSKFSLDLNGGTGAPSRLGLGATNRSWGVGAVQWSSKQYELSFHRLELFDLSICGASLLGAVSNHWPALVDTGASCLALPAELHDALFAWVGVMNCTESAPTADQRRYDAPLHGVGRRCWLPGGISPSTLPVLSFRLSQHAPQLQLPLEELLLPPVEDGSRELCIRVRASSSNHAPFQLPIIIGTKWLNHFVAHFEMLPGQRRVGFAPKQMPLTRATDAARRAASCAKPAQCTGQQRYVAATNRCEPPQCTAFFVQLDEESGTCVYWTSFRVMLTAVLGAFSVAELVLHQAQQRLPRLCSVPPDQHGPLLRFFMRVWARPTS